MRLALIAMMVLSGADAGTTNPAMEVCRQLAAAKVLFGCSEAKSPDDAWSSSAPWKVGFEVKADDLRTTSGTVAVFYGEVDFRRAIDFASDPANRAGPWRFASQKLLTLLIVERRTTPERALAIEAALVGPERDAQKRAVDAIDEQHRKQEEEDLWGPGGRPKKK